MAFVYTWFGTTDSNWGNFLNWVPQNIPTPGSDFLSDTSVVFSTGAPVTGPGTANFFYVDASTAFSGAFSAVGQPAYGLSPFFTALQVTGGAATFSGATTSLLTRADVLVGFGDTGGAPTAELDFVNGAQATLNTDQVIDLSLTRIAESSVYVGYDHNGIMNVLGSGTQVTTDNGIELGNDTGVNGTLHVGSGATLHNGYSLGAFGFYIGYGGSGNLLIDSGGKVTGDGYAEIGTLAGSSGSVLVDGAGSDWHQSLNILVGFNPGTTGTLIISNGATVETDQSVKVGSGPEPVGTPEGTGTVIIESGGSLTSTGLSGAGARIFVQAGGEIVMQTGSTLSATGTDAADSTLEGVQVAAGGLVTGIGTISGTYIQNDGIINANSIGGAGTLVLNSLTAAIADPATPGTLSISGDATLEVIGGVASTETVVFNNTAETGFHETLKIDGSVANFQASVSGLQAGDAIDLAGVTGATTWSLNSTTNVLTVTDASGAQLGSLHLIGNYANTNFAATSDGHGGFMLTESQTAQAPTITSGGGGTKSEYVLDHGQHDITTIQASGTDVHYYIVDPRTDHLVASTSQFSIDANTGHLSFNGTPGDGSYHVTVVAQNSAGQTSQNLTVAIDDDHVLAGNPLVTDTFVFHTGFRNDLVANFNVADTAFHGVTLPHSTIQIDHSLFTGATAGETGAALVALLTAHTQQVGRLGTLITTDDGEHIFLAGVNKQALLSNASADFHFV